MGIVLFGCRLDEQPLETVQAAVPAALVLVPHVFVGDLLMGEYDLGDLALVDEFDGDQCLNQFKIQVMWLVLPGPGEDQIFWPVDNLVDTVSDVGSVFARLQHPKAILAANT